MNTRLIRILQAVVILGLLGCVGIQALLLAAPFFDPGDPAAGNGRGVAIAVIVAGFICVEVAMVCVWRLLGFVARGTVFSPASLRWVDVIIGAIAVGAIPVLILGYIVGELDDAPGLILVFAVLSLLVAGVALVVWVQRMLLVQAVGFSAELEQVI